MTAATEKVMLKQSIFAALILCLPAVVLTGCDKDEPAVVTPETPVTPDNPDDKDNPDKDGDENPGSSDNPGDKGEKKVVINTDGTTSDGAHFRRIDETTFMLNYVKYKIRDGHIEVTGYDNSEIELTLKGKVDLYSTIEIDNVSYNVREIENGAFRECSSLKEINIPNSINVIGQRASFLCEFLEKVNLPNSINVINSETFSRCSSLAHIDIPEGVKEIRWYAFSGCSSLVHIDIPEGVKNIDFAAFANCENLGAISLPSTLESFNYYKGYSDDFESRIRFIYIKAITPPKFGNMHFTFMIRIFVPEQELKAYESSSWSSDSREYKTNIIGVDTETFDFKEYLNGWL